MDDVLGGDLPDGVSGEFDRDFGPGASGEIDDHPGQRFVEGGVEESVSCDSGAGGQRAVQKGSQKQARILDRMVQVDFQIACSGKGQVEKAMAADLVKKVVEKRACPSRSGLFRCRRAPGSPRSLFPWWPWKVLPVSFREAFHRIRISWLSFQNAFQ